MVAHTHFDSKPEFSLWLSMHKRCRKRFEQQPNKNSEGLHDDCQWQRPKGAQTANWDNRSRFLTTLTYFNGCAVHSKILRCQSNINKISQPILIDSLSIVAIPNKNNKRIKTDLFVCFIFYYYKYFVLFVNRMKLVVVICNFFSLY